MPNRATILVAVLTFHCVAAAQESRPTGVVVTARKWEEDVFRVPQSVTAFSDRQIEDAHVREIRDAARYLPNTLVTGFSSRRLSFPFVRGVGSGQGDPAVATFYDGVPQLQISSTNLALLDVERIEFLRGPAGALHGRNTIGGAIHVLSREPTGEFEAGARATFGNFHARDYRVWFETPLDGDRLSLRFAGLHEERDGYSINDTTGRSVDDRDAWAGRVQLLWRPTSSISARLTLFGERARDGGFVLSSLSGLRSNPNHLQQDFEGRADRDTAGVTLAVKQETERGEATSITSVGRWYIRETSDFDFSVLDGVRRETRGDEGFVYQELRFADNEFEGIELFGEMRLRTLFGGSGFYSESSQSAANDFRPGGAGILFPPANVGVDASRGEFEAYSLALFAQATLELGDDLELAAAVRYEYESRDADIRRTFTTGGFMVPTASSDLHRSFDEVLPRFSLSYHLSDKATMYGLAARGFKAGGFNLTAPGGRETFGPERSWTYEVGTRLRLCEERLTASAAVFYIDWQDMQLSQFDATAGGYVVNAGKSRSRGAELELKLRPCEDEAIELFAGLGWLDTEFTSFRDQFGQNVAGRRLPFAPKDSFHVGAQWLGELDDGVSVRLRAEYFHVGRFYYDAGNAAGENYRLANVQVGLVGDCWSLTGFLHNALDDRYVPIAFQPNPADPSQFVGESAAPRTYGLALEVRF